MEKRITEKDRITACLLGGAAGDALGYAVEFDSESDIQAKYGRNGIQKYDKNGGVALISDDTQMTMFTAAALAANPAFIENRDAAGLRDAIRLAYKDWYRTQTGNFAEAQSRASVPLGTFPTMFAQRAPGMTCMDALSQAEQGSTKSPINNSKGCGGVMRTAPVALALHGIWSPVESSLLAAEAAALTHGHPAGWLSSAALNHLLLELLDGTGLNRAVDRTQEALETQFPEKPETKELTKLLNWAYILSKSNCTDLEGIHALGEGWTGDEALAIAVFCALRHPDDFGAGIQAAVNHKGDSDSTGAIAGQILGAYLGQIPKKWTAGLEHKNTIESLARSLANKDSYTKTKGRVA